jgi:hypothetical protein
MRKSKKSKTPMSVTEQLTLFLARVDKLRKTRFVQEPGALSLRIAQKQGEPMTIESEEPDEEVVQACLPILRQFLMDGEPINLNLMYKLCLAHIDNIKAQDDIKTAAEAWKRRQKKGGLLFVHNDKVITPEYIKYLYLAYEFHSDNEEANRIIPNLGPIEQKFYRHEFIDFLQGAIDHITHLESWIRYALDKRQVSETVLSLKDKKEGN